MKLEDAINAADGLDPKIRATTAKMIDLKVESDMRELVTEMRNEFVSLKKELVHMENKLSTGYTFFGIALAVLAIMVAMLVFRHPL